MDLRCSTLIVFLICQVSSSDNDHTNDVCTILCQPLNYTTQYCTELKVDLRDTTTTLRGAIFSCCLGVHSRGVTVDRIEYLKTNDQMEAVATIIKRSFADDTTLSKVYAECIRNCHFTDLKNPWTFKDIEECAKGAGLCKPSEPPCRV